MSPAPKLSIFSNRCPHCQSGTIFSWGFWMNRNCGVCGKPFENEEGHYIGAMIIAYFINAFLALPTLLWCAFRQEMELAQIFLVIGIQLCITTPVLYRYSKLVWIQLEHRLSKKLNHTQGPS